MELNEIKFSAIACITKTGGLGFKNELLFRIKEDLNFFKYKTENHMVVMGRKTFESIGKPLPNRFNIVLTNNAVDFNINQKYENCIFLNKISDIPKIINNNHIFIHDDLYSVEVKYVIPKYINTSEIFIIGGQSIYQRFEKYISKYYLTIIDSDKEYDAFLPMFKELINKYNCLNNIIEVDKNWLYYKPENYFDEKSGLNYTRIIMDKFE